MASFRVQVLRLTIFAAPVPLEALAAWNLITSAQPDVSENRIKDGLQRTAGGWRSAQLEVHSRQGRLDVIVVLRAAQMAQSLDFGFAKVEATEFLKTVRPLVSQLPQSQRIALGGVFLMKTDNATQSAALFSAHTGIEPAKIEGCRDLMFRCNRPQEVDGIKFNRLRTWQSIQIQNFSGATMPTLFQSEDHFLQLDLDHNTPVEMTAIANADGVVNNLGKLMLEDIGGDA